MPDQSEQQQQQHSGVASQDSDPRSPQAQNKPALSILNKSNSSPVKSQIANENQIKRSNNLKLNTTSSGPANSSTISTPDMITPTRPSVVPTQFPTVASDVPGSNKYGSVSFTVPDQTEKSHRGSISARPSSVQINTLGQPIQTQRSHNRSNNIILHLLQLSKLQQQQQRQMKHSAKLAHHLKQMCLDSLQSQTAYHRLYHQETLAFPVSPTLLLILQDKILTQILISLISLLIHSQTIITIHNIISQELNHLNQLIEIKAPHQPLTNAVLHHLCHSLLQSLKTKGETSQSCYRNTNYTSSIL